jgi:hypothetical protein
MGSIEIFLQTILIIICLYLAFFKSYFHEKGKNIATKEDIKEITGLVETIKNQIHYTTQSKFSLRIEERNALVKHYEKYNYWLNTLLDTYFGGINEENKLKLKELEQKLNDARFKYEIATGRKEVFVDNKEIDELVEYLKTKTLELHNTIDMSISELEYWFFEVETMRKTTPIEQQVSKYRELTDKRLNMMKKNNKDKFEIYKEIAPKVEQFKILVYNHLQKIIKG